jgi:hypothetical protein
MRHRAGIALAALALAGTGCGGDDGSDEPEVNINDVLACVQDQGLKAIATAGDEPLGITESLRISLPPDNRITVDFFSEADQAEAYAEFLRPGPGRKYEVVGNTIAIGSLRGDAAEELAHVKGCID